MPSTSLPLHEVLHEKHDSLSISPRSTLYASQRIAVAKSIIVEGLFVEFQGLILMGASGGGGRQVTYDMKAPQLVCVIAGE